MEGLYVLIDDNSKVAALFQNDEETGDVIRRNGDWSAPTLSEIEEWDGFLVVTIEPSFIEMFDKAQASGETLDESAVQEYKTEMSQ
jgi:hypothetical protein